MYLKFLPFFKATCGIGLISFDKTNLISNQKHLLSFDLKLGSLVYKNGRKQSFAAYLSLTLDLLEVTRGWSVIGA